MLEAVELLAGQIGVGVAIRGNSDQDPFSLPCLLRGVDAFLMDLMDVLQILGTTESERLSWG